MDVIRKGRMDNYNLNGFKLHAYESNDPIGDYSFIVEGEDGLVTIEHPIFKDNIEEFNAYIKLLDKPLVAIIADYHIGGFDEYDQPIIMTEGMPEFVKTEAYVSMMKHFHEAFGDAIDTKDMGKVKTVKIGSVHKWAGVDFKFVKGASNDFPAASIIIGDEVYYSHWAPTKSHISYLQVGSAEAVNGELKAYIEERDSGCLLFIGSHGGVCSLTDLNFKIDYLEMVQKLLLSCIDYEEFAKALKAAYPGLPGEDGVEELAKKLYNEQELLPD